MKVNRLELLKSLITVKPGLATEKTSATELFSSFAFLEGRVITYNDEISISHPVKGLNLIKGAINAKRLFGLLLKLEQEEVELGVMGNEIRIKAGKAKAGLPLLQQEIPLDTPIIDWKPLPKDFMDGVQFAIFSCSKDVSRPVLTCINICEDGRIESSDSLCITRYQITSKMPIKDFLLPQSSAKELVKYVPISIAEGKGWVHFLTMDNTIFSCRTFGDKFPDVSVHLKAEGDLFCFPKIASEVIERASIFSNQEFDTDEFIEFTLAPGNMKIRGESDNGWFEERIDFDWIKEEAISILINPKLMQHILNKGQNKCLLTEKTIKFEGDNWEHVIALGKRKRGEI